MKLKEKNIGLCVTGSFCNFSKLDDVISDLKKAKVNSILPIVSTVVLSDTNRFSNPISIRKKLENLTGNKLIDTISGAEPIGPKKMVDIMLVFPCTRKYFSKT